MSADPADLRTNRLIPVPGGRVPGRACDTLRSPGPKWPKGTRSAQMLKLYVSAQNRLARLARKDSGATAVEYGLIVALIAAVIVVIVGTLGTQVSQAFSKVSANMP
jgi:pilus assembly protein Flp/PilA